MRSWNHVHADELTHAAGCRRARIGRRLNGSNVTAHNCRYKASADTYDYLVIHAASKERIRRLN